MNKRRIRFIVNPISGVGKQKIIPGLVKQYLDHGQFDYEITYTEAAGHAITLSKEAAEAGIDIVAIVGGDGSVNEAGSSLINSTTALAIIPTGSGNGLARHLKIPLKLQEAISLLNHHQVKMIDTGMVNEHRFMGVAGIGFDALIAYEFSRFGKRGFFSYFKIVLREYFNYKEDRYSIKHQGKELLEKAFLITIANSSQYGNRATIAPEAKIDDGHLKLCLLKKFPLWVAPFVANRLFNKTIHKSRYMTTIDGTEFSISSSYNRVHTDGEPLTIDETLLFKVNPASLNVIVPQ